MACESNDPRVIECRFEESEHWVSLVPPMNHPIFATTQDFKWNCTCGDWDDGFETLPQCMKAANGHLLNPESPAKYSS